MTKEELEKEAEELIQRFEMANSMNCFMQLTPDRKQMGEMLVMIAEPREKRIADLEKEKAELKARLNAINLLTPELEKSAKLKKQQLTKAKDLIRTLLLVADNKVSQMEFQLCVADAEQFLKEVEK